MPHQLNHALNNYFAVSFSPSTAYQSDLIKRAHPAVSSIQPVGELKDVHVVEVPKDSGVSVEDMVKELRAVQGVVDVQFQELRQRAKRDEF